MNLETLSLHCFGLIPGIGTKGLAKISNRGAAQLWISAKIGDFETILSSKPRAWEAYQLYRSWNHKELLQEQHEYLRSTDIQILMIKDDLYPRLLREISVPPTLLYVRGNLEALGETIAIIGTRKYSSYGEQTCYQLSYDLARAGMVVVSGLALGIDSIAHRACLDAKGRTIAVLGGGIDNSALYPRSSYQIAQEIITSGGALISEFAPLIEPRREFFVLRNRIVAGLSRGILVIEAPKKSGTMITVEYGLSENRDIFAVPGNITQKNSEGTNYLIQKGAQLVTRVEDILESLSLNVQMDAYSVEALSPEHKAIIRILEQEPQSLDNLSRVLGRPLTEVMTQVSLLELEGVLGADRAGNYHLKVQVITR